MTKTPEQMAEEYAELMSFDVRGHQRGFLAGYQAAKDEDKAKMQELEANWKFCCEDKARLLNELAAAERAKDQLADAGKVMNSPKKLDSWISVKERLPNLEKTSRSLRRESSCILLVSYGNVYVAHLCEDWTDRSHFIFEACTCNCRAFDMDIDEWKLDQVTYWMPLPKPPEDK